MFQWNWFLSLLFFPHSLCSTGLTMRSRTTGILQWSGSTSLRTRKIAQQWVELEGFLIDSWTPFFWDETVRLWHCQCRVIVMKFLIVSFLFPKFPPFNHCTWQVTHVDIVTLWLELIGSAFSRAVNMQYDCLTFKCRHQERSHVDNLAPLLAYRARFSSHVKMVGLCLSLFGIFCVSETKQHANNWFNLDGRKAVRLTLPVRTKKSFGALKHFSVNFACLWMRFLWWRKLEKSYMFLCWHCKIVLFFFSSGTTHTFAFSGRDIKKSRQVGYGLAWCYM